MLSRFTADIERWPSVLSQLAVLDRHRPGELTREQLATLLPPGAARNAVDCAISSGGTQRAP